MLAHTNALDSWNQVSAAAIFSHLRRQSLFWSLPFSLRIASNHGNIWRSAVFFAASAQVYFFAAITGFLLTLATQRRSLHTFRKWQSLR